MQRLKRALWFLWKLLFGGVLCQYLLSSILAVGWTYRLMQRTAVKRWWAMSDAPDKGNSFKQWAEESPSAHDHVTFPNWIVRPRGLSAMRQDIAHSVSLRERLGAIRHGFFGSLWENAVIGVQGIANVWVLTLLPALLWEFGWYSGWDNSFNKGYEQYYVGIALSWTGVVLFLLVMLYLPMAQARQAVTGEWRSFYKFRTVWQLVRRRRLANLLLALCFSLLSVPVTLFKTLPYGFAGMNPNINSMPASELLKLLDSYFFWTSIAGFAVFVTLRIVAARIYAGAVVEAFQKGAIGVGDLGDLEGRALLELGLVSREEERRRNIAVEAVVKAARPAWAFATVMATLLVWFTFVAQIYVSEFLNYHPQRGFVNQSLIQLPWFRYVPDHLVEAAKEESEIPAQTEGQFAAVE